MKNGIKYLKILWEKNVFNKKNAIVIIKFILKINLINLWFYSLEIIQDFQMSIRYQYLILNGYNPLKKIDKQISS